MNIESISNNSSQVTSNNTSKINSLKSKLESLESQKESLENNTSIESETKQSQIQTIESQIQLVQSQIQELSSKSNENISNKQDVEQKNSEENNGDEVREGVVISKSLKEKIEANHSIDTDDKEKYYNEQKRMEEKNSTYTYSQLYANKKLEQ